MNVVLDRIERELTASIGRRVARRRRRRSLAAVAGATLAALTLAGAGVASVSDSPLDRLLHGAWPLAERPAADGGTRVEMQVGDDGLGWTVVAYTTTDGNVGTTALPDGLRTPLPGLSASGFGLAGDLLDGPLASNELQVVETTADGRLHYLLSGLVDAQARAVTVELGGQRIDARLSDGAISAPVEIPTDDLTAEGRSRAARMPREILVRSFAAAPAPDSLAGEEVVQATVTVTAADGSVRTAKTARFCVVPACGVRPAEID